AKVGLWNSEEKIRNDKRRKSAEGIGNVIAVFLLKCFSVSELSFCLQSSVYIAAPSMGLRVVWYVWPWPLEEQKEEKCVLVYSYKITVGISMTLFEFRLKGS
ncbi:hypothetical protein U1Q18_048689, partial [Sarracenia purpurea var. burkii]